MFELVKTLTELPGMIGHEEPVQEFLCQRWEPHCQQVRITGVGNVMANSAPCFCHPLYPQPLRDASRERFRAVCGSFAQVRHTTGQLA